MKILEKVTSEDGATKYLLELDDKLRVESVFLDLMDNAKDSLCVSSQVGCPLTCTFCSTGKIGYKRNLTPEEILEQVGIVFDDMGFNPSRRFDLSYMGMGEPLLNLTSVRTSKNLISEKIPGLNYFISTIGIAPKIRELAKTPEFGLQVSLHAPEDSLRSRIMPINKAHSIREVLDAAESYADASDRSVILNYCLMHGVNDSHEHARLLASILKGRRFRVQLVKFNPHISIGYSPSTDQQVDIFLETLAENEVRAHYGRQLGSREGAGCGQLDADYEEGHFRASRSGSQTKL